jgi:hypothetical protein
LTERYKEALNVYNEGLELYTVSNVFINLSQNIKARENNLNNLNYSNFENVSLGNPEIKGFIEVIDNYYKNITEKIQNIALLQLRLEVYSMSLLNLKRIHKTLETESGKIISKYQQINENIFNLNSNVQNKSREYKPFINFQNNLLRFRPDDEVVGSLTNVIDKDNTSHLFFTYLVKQYGWVKEVSLTTKL